MRSENGGRERRLWPTESPADRGEPPTLSFQSTYVLPPQRPSAPTPRDKSIVVISWHGSWSTRRTSTLESALVMVGLWGCCQPHQPNRLPLRRGETDVHTPALPVHATVGAWNECISDDHDCLKMRPPWRGISGTTHEQVSSETCCVSRVCGGPSLGTIGKYHQPRMWARGVTSQMSQGVEGY